MQQRLLQALQQLALQHVCAMVQQLRLRIRAGYGVQCFYAVGQGADEHTESVLGDFHGLESPSTYMQNAVVAAGSRPLADLPFDD